MVTRRGHLGERSGRGDGTIFPVTSSHPALTSRSGDIPADAPSVTS